MNRGEGEDFRYYYIYAYNKDQVEEVLNRFGVLYSYSLHGSTYEFMISTVPSKAFLIKDYFSGTQNVKITEEKELIEDTFTPKASEGYYLSIYHSISGSSSKVIYTAPSNSYIYFANILLNATTVGGSSNGNLSIDIKHIHQDASEDIIFHADIPTRQNTTSKTEHDFFYLKKELLEGEYIQLEEEGVNVKADIYLYYFTRKK